jgi:hypothetical protein
LEAIFINTKSLGIMAKNRSDLLAKDPRYVVSFWNLDEKAAFQGLPAFKRTDSGDFISPSKLGSGPYAVFDLYGPAAPLTLPRLKHGDRLFGFASVDCSNCDTAACYWIYYVYGVEGWYNRVTETSEIGCMTSYDKVRMKVIGNFAELSRLAPMNSRITIKDEISDERTAVAHLNVESPPDCVELARIPEAQRVPLTFRNSRLFEDTARRCRIRAAISTLHTYLTDVGYDLSREIPPLDTIPGKAVVMARITPGTVYEANIRIPEGGVDDRDAVQNIYALWIFRDRFGLNDLPSAVAASLYSCYYRSDLSNNNVCGSDWDGAEWGRALWDMRKQNGAGFVDRALLYAYRRWNETTPRSEDFSAFFLPRFLRGVSVTLSSADDASPMNSILQTHGLMPKNSVGPRD